MGLLLCTPPLFFPKYLQTTLYAQKEESCSLTEKLLVGRKPPELPKDQDTLAALLLSSGVWAAETGGSSPQGPRTPHCQQGAASPPTCVHSCLALAFLNKSSSLSNW